MNISIYYRIYFYNPLLAVCEARLCVNKNRREIYINRIKKILRGVAQKW